MAFDMRFHNRRHADTVAASSRQCFCCGAVNLSDSNQHNLLALARLSDNKASYRNFITLALGKHLVDNAPSVGVLRCSKIQETLGIKIFARGRISTGWLVPHYAG